MVLVAERVEPGAFLISSVFAGEPDCLIALLIHSRVPGRMVLQYTVSTPIIRGSLSYPEINFMTVPLKSPDEIEKMRIAGKLASEVLDYITPFVKPGVTTDELDRLCHEYMVSVQGTIPAPLNYAPPGYPPYPKSICTSVNHQVCHGIPGQKTLKSGDILNIDVTVIKDGYHGDTSRMYYRWRTGDSRPGGYARSPMSPCGEALRRSNRASGWEISAMPYNSLQKNTAIAS